MVFNITRPCHGSQIDYFTISLYKVTSLLHGSLITRSVSMDPEDSVIMRLTCIQFVDFNMSKVVNLDDLVYNFIKNGHSYTVSSVMFART